jgi:hypothetical protein
MQREQGCHNNLLIPALVAPRLPNCHVHDHDLDLHHLRSVIGGAGQSYLRMEPNRKTLLDEGKLVRDLRKVHFDLSRVDLVPCFAL